MKNLLIVESPAKARTIEKYLGKDFTVKASYGHIRDLPKGDQAVDIEHGYRPTYEIPEDKQSVVKDLQSDAQKAEQVWLATDEDREGEAISWHLAEVLNLSEEQQRRIVFHEITKPAIQQAIQQPRKIDMNLVNAQQARRVLDRIVGFELSPILWRKVRSGLSAGRVQSVAVRLIVEREREIMQFEPEAFFRVRAKLYPEEGNVFQAELSKRLQTIGAAQDLLDAAREATFKVASLEKKPVKRKPAPPFTTSTLQQEAGRKLSFPVGLTMRAAQSLYEAGHITYMRTDSVNLSQQARNDMERVIKQQFGEQYHKHRNFQTKNEGAQEAHEAIRPTDFGARNVGKDDAERKLYDLIWKRAVASQMADAELERTIVKVDIDNPQRPDLPQLTATGEIIKFEGFLKLYLESKDEDDAEENVQGLLPALREGQALNLQEMNATERFTQPPSRYTESSLVKKLEQLQIGRPSTYAPTISTIQKRNYVAQEDREGRERRYRILALNNGQVEQTEATEITGRERNKLFPTDLGMLVTDFLLEHFENVMSYSFTAEVEDDFDKIASGNERWQEMIDHFYRVFHPKVEQTAEQAERASGERPLGEDPETGKPVIARMGRYGPLVQIGTQDDPEKRFAGLRKNQRLETVTLAEALKLFELPRTVGRYEEHPITANVGRFGPYVFHRDKF
jgi:DNA topoisomerase-1